MSLSNLFTTQSINDSQGKREGDGRGGRQRGGEKGKGGVRRGRRGGGESEGGGGGSPLCSISPSAENFTVEISKISFSLEKL